MDSPRSKRKRDNSDSSDQNDTTKENTITISENPKKLILPIKESGFICCQNKTKGDCLIQATTDQDILFELAQKRHSSSPENALDLFHQIEKDRLVYNLILPYLSLLDMVSISQSSDRLHRIVEKFVKDGNRITLDDQMIRRYPLTTNLEFYSQFKTATNVSLRKIPYNQLTNIFNIFHHVDTLAMEEMKVLGDIGRLPQSLTGLSISNSQIEHQGLLDWLHNMRNTLQTLNLDTVQTEYCPSKDYCWDLQFDKICNQLRILSLKGKRISLSGHFKQLRSLKVVAFAFKYNFENCPKLEHLHYNVVDFSDLKSFLETSEINCMTKRLKTVKIVRSVDPQYNGIMKRLAGKKMDVHYYTSPEPNLIFRLLNDDCLSHIMQFLPLGSYLNFSKSHQRIADLIADGRQWDLINSGSWGLCDLGNWNPNLFHRIAPTAHPLRIQNRRNVQQISLPILTGLKRLELADVELNQTSLDRLPNTLESLTLHKLFYATWGLEWSNNIGNLREIILDTTVMSSWVAKILENNKSTLEHISLTVRQGRSLDTFAIDWIMVKKMPKFKHLSLSCWDYTNDPHVGHLQILRIMLVMKSRIRKLTLHASPEQIVTTIMACHKGLEELQIKGSPVLLLEYMNVLYTLKELRKLTLTHLEADDLCHVKVLEIIVNLPKLTTLTLNKFSATLQFELQLKEYLRNKGRVLHIIVQ